MFALLVKKSQAVAQPVENVIVLPVEMSQAVALPIEKSVAVDQPVENVIVLPVGEQRCGLLTLGKAAVVDFSSVAARAVVAVANMLDEAIVAMEAAVVDLLDVAAEAVARAVVVTKAVVDFFTVPTDMSIEAVGKEQCQLCHHIKEC